jgi:hypothetical protein
MNIFQSNALQNFTQIWIFCFEKKTSGNPAGAPKTFRFEVDLCRRSTCWASLCLDGIYLTVFYCNYFLNLYKRNVRFVRVQGLI